MSIGGFPHDTRHLSPAQVGALLATKPGPFVRQVAALYGFQTNHRPLARLIEQIVAYRAGWPRPAVGLPAYSNECH